MRFLLLLIFLIFATVPVYASEDAAYKEYTLGGRYLIGKGVPQDNKQAAQHFRKAADQGLSIAQYYLSRAYADGRGVPQDNNEAFFWITIAARGGDKFILDYQGELAKKLTGTQITEIQRNAAEWIPGSPAGKP